MNARPLLAEMIKGNVEAGSDEARKNGIGNDEGQTWRAAFTTPPRNGTNVNF